MQIHLCVLVHQLELKVDKLKCSHSISALLVAVCHCLHVGQIWPGQREPRRADGRRGGAGLHQQSPQPSPLHPHQQGCQAWFDRFNSLQRQ